MANTIMTNLEIRQIFNDLKEQMQDGFKVVREDIKEIRENQKGHDKQIVDLEKQNLKHIADCPLAIRVKFLEDNQIGYKAVKKFKYQYLSYGVMMTTILTLILKLFKVI